MGIYLKIRTHLGATLIVLGACTDPYNRTRMVCANDGQIMTYDVDLNAISSIDRACANRIVEVFDIEVDSFPEDFRDEFSVPSNILETIIAGFYVIVSSNEEAVLSSIEDKPPVLNIAIKSMDMGNRVPTNEFWFHLLEKSIYSISMADDIDYSIWMSSMAWYKHVHGLPINEPPYIVASMIIHESIHNYVSHDAVCSETTNTHCDSTPNGAYGVQSLWLYNWATHNNKNLSINDCDYINKYINWVCYSQIIDSSDFIYCKEEINVCDL